MPLTIRIRQPAACRALSRRNTLLALLLATSTSISAQTSTPSLAPLATPDNQKGAPHNIPPAQDYTRYVHPIPLAQDYSHYLKLVSATPTAPRAIPPATPPHPQPQQSPILIKPH